MALLPLLPSAPMNQDLVFSVTCRRWMFTPVLLNPLHPRDPPDPPDPPDPTVTPQSKPPSSSSLHQTPPPSSPPISLASLSTSRFRTSCFFHEICYRGLRTETTQICLTGGTSLSVVLVSLVPIGDTNFVKCLTSAVCSLLPCRCADPSPHLSFPGNIFVLHLPTLKLVNLFAAPTTGSFPPIFPIDQVLSPRLSNSFFNGLVLYLALVWPVTAVCSPLTALCSPYTMLYSSTSVVLESFVVLETFKPYFIMFCASTVLYSFTLVIFESMFGQLWKLDGLMIHISIRPIVWVLLDVYGPGSFSMERVSLLTSSSTLSEMDTRSLMLKIRVTSSIEVLIKGYLAMLKIVNCALVAVSISGCLSLIVVSQGFISLSSYEFRGLLYDISCLCVVCAPIFICCICSLVIGVSFDLMVMSSVFVNILSIYGE